MNILVTGSSGYIGRELVQHLSKKHLVKEYDVAQGSDIFDQKKLRRAMAGCDVVIHLAAIPKPVEGKTFPEYFRTNCEATLQVAEAAVAAGVRRIVYASSTTYYGIERGIPFIKPVKESNPVVTQHLHAADLKCRDCDIAYSTSKVIAEQVLANYGLMKRIEVIILRIGPTRGYGEHRPFLGTNLKMENALAAFEKAATLRKRVWYEAMTIADRCPGVDLRKAKRVLGYVPG